MDFTNIIMQAEILAIIGILITMAYFFIKLGLFKTGPKKPKAPKPEKQSKKADK